MGGEGKGVSWRSEKQPPGQWMGLKQISVRQFISRITNKCNSEMIMNKLKSIIPMCQVYSLDRPVGCPDSTRTISDILKHIFK